MERDLPGERSAGSTSVLSGMTTASDAACLGLPMTGLPVIGLQRAGCGEIGKDRIVGFGQQQIAGGLGGARSANRRRGAIAAAHAAGAKQAGRSARFCPMRARADRYAPFGHHAASRRFGRRLVVIASQKKRRQHRYHEDAGDGDRRGDMGEIERAAWPVALQARC